jgi:hypothetical protein
MLKKSCKIKHGSIENESVKNGVQVHGRRRFPENPLGELLAQLLNQRGRFVGCAALGQSVDFVFPKLIVL